MSRSTAARVTAPDPAEPEAAATGATGPALRAARGFLMLEILDGDGRVIERVGVGEIISAEQSE